MAGSKWARKEFLVVVPMTQELSVDPSALTVGACKCHPHVSVKLYSSLVRRTLAFGFVISYWRYHLDEALKVYEIKTK